MNAPQDDIQDQSESLMTIRDVAEYLRLSEDKVYRMAKAGQIPCFKIGKQWRFRRSEIDLWLETQARGRET